MTLDVTTSISSLLQCSCRYTERIMSTKTRVQLSDAVRKEICELANSNRDLSQGQLTRLAAEKLSKDLKPSTLVHMLHSLAAHCC